MTSLIVYLVCATNVKITGSLPTQLVIIDVIPISYLVI